VLCGLEPSVIVLAHVRNVDSTNRTESRVFDLKVIRMLQSLLLMSPSNVHQAYHHFSSSSSE